METRLKLSADAQRYEALKTTLLRKPPPPLLSLCDSFGQYIVFRTHGDAASLAPACNIKTKDPGVTVSKLIRTLKKAGLLVVQDEALHYPFRTFSLLNVTGKPARRSLNKASHSLLKLRRRKWPY